MRILITNAFLDHYRGTEVVVRDLALELRRQGHLPAVYSPRLGRVAKEIRNAGVEVADQLTNLSSAPDIIHGQHHQTLEALLYFPSVPAIHVAHGASFVEMPIHFPRIVRYVAVDDRVRKCVDNAAGISAGRIEVICNAVDLARFQRRGPLPAKPRRALVFSNNASRSTHLPAVRKACRQAGLELDVVGLEAGNEVEHPENLLPDYDIVFAKARCALESLAVGNAVVLCDTMGLGPMVSSRNFDVLRPMNFGAGVLTNPLHPELIRKEIERYDAGDAALVCQRVREEAGLVQAVEHWIRLYTTVIEEFRCSERNVDDELRALAIHVASWNYHKRVEWEREQLHKLKSVPVIGRPMLYLARRVLAKMTDRWGLP